MANILIIGGGGFIGRHGSAALREAGHLVTCPGRHQIDLARLTLEDLSGDGINLIREAEVVINCAGLVRDQAGASQQAVHLDGATALFRLCASLPTPSGAPRRLIQLSALGAAADADTPYQSSKGAAEEALRALAGPLDICILRPSLVIGRGGASTGLLAGFAALPILPRLGGGKWLVQPLLVEDLAEALVRLVAFPAPWPAAYRDRGLELVGPEPMSTDLLLQTLHHWLGAGHHWRGATPRFLPIPTPLLKLAVWAGEKLTAGPVNRQMIHLLAHGNVGDPAPLTRLLGHPPRPLSRLSPAGPGDRLAARLTFLGQPLRWSLALLWIWTGLVSLGLYPIAQSRALTESLGVSGDWADLAIYSGGLAAIANARYRQNGGGGRRGFTTALSPLFPPLVRPRLARFQRFDVGLLADGRQAGLLSNAPSGRLLAKPIPHQRPDQPGRTQRRQRKIEQRNPAARKQRNIDPSAKDVKHID